MSDVSKKTIQDFDAQWTRYTDNDGYYGSINLFQDICGPLLPIECLKNCRAMEIGSGAGRIVNMLLDAGVAHVVAVEPSDAIEVLKSNTQSRADKVQYIKATGENIPDIKVDYAFSIGVLHHIPNPVAVVSRVYEALNPGGKFLFWVYGREGNELYLTVVTPLRKMAQLMPDFILAGLSHFLNLFLTVYIFLCQFLPLPLHRYMQQVIGKFDWKKRSLVIFDQLNPAYAKYYDYDEAFSLMKAGGFANIQLHHRHGYSWTVIGEKIAANPGD